MPPRAPLTDAIALGCPREGTPTDEVCHGSTAIDDVHPRRRAHRTDRSGAHHRSARGRRAGGRRPARQTVPPRPGAGTLRVRSERVRSPQVARSRDRVRGAGRRRARRIRRSQGRPAAGPEHDSPSPEWRDPVHDRTDRDDGSHRPGDGADHAGPRPRSGAERTQERGLQSDRCHDDDGLAVDLPPRARPQVANDEGGVSDASEHRGSDGGCRGGQLQRRGGRHGTRGAR